MSPIAAYAQSCGAPATREDVIQAQQMWGKAIVAIGQADDAKKEAQKTLDELYAYDHGTRVNIISPLSKTMKLRLNTALAMYKMTTVV